MGVEIERRFLVNPGKLPEDFWEAHSVRITQAYLTQDPWVRIRLVHGNTPKAVLTVKGAGTLKRPEVNCEVSWEDAQDLWKMAKFGEIHKIRHNYGRWEVDEFTDAHAGLWIAEYEFKPGENTRWDPVGWVGREVTEDHRYSNAHMAKHGIPVEERS